MKLRVAKKLHPLFYENPHSLPRVQARIEGIEPEEPTQVGEEEEPTIKGAIVTFRPTSGRSRKNLTARMERKKLIRLAHATGKLGTAPGSTVDVADLVGGTVNLFIETRHRDGYQRIARFTSLDGPFGG